jgi:hypothetical protein
MFRLGTRILVTTALILGAPAAAAAGRSPHDVDPLTMIPRLNPAYTWACFDTGSGPICQGTFETSYTNEPIDMRCSGRPVYVTGTGNEHATRWHDAEHRALKTRVNLDYPADHLTLSPTGDGPSVTVRSHWERHYVYAIPGDIASRSVTELGAVYVATAPGQGVVFHDVGLITFAPGQDFETIAVMHGPHDFYSNFDAVQAAVCAILAA